MMMRSSGWQTSESEPVYERRRLDRLAEVAIKCGVNRTVWNVTGRTQDASNFCKQMIAYLRIMCADDLVVDDVY